MNYLENTLNISIQAICLFERLKSLKDTKNTERKEIQANWIKSTLTDFKNKIKNISKNEIEFEQPNEIAGILLKSYLKILEFNRRNQQGQGLKSLSPSQMLSILPISLISLIQKNIKMKSEKYCIFCTDEKTYKKHL